MVASRTFSSSHAWALAFTGNDTRLRLPHAADLGITERSAYGIVTDLAETGWVVKRDR